MGWKLNSNHDGKLMSEINITPLTDVMMVLLVIFMVTTPLLMTDAFKVRLPKAVSAASDTSTGAIVAVSADGGVSLNGQSISFDALSASLKDAVERSSDKTVIVKADGSARHSMVVAVLDAARKAGAERLSIATERAQK